MTAPSTVHRLDGLEPDNLLAFLALLGLMRVLDTVDRTRARDERIHPRAAWAIDRPPLRPVLHLRSPATREELLESAATGLEALAAHHDFDGQKDLNYSGGRCREILDEATATAAVHRRERADLLAALMTDAAIKDEKESAVDPTPLCLLFGQGHQHFLDRLARVPRDPAPPRGKGKKAVPVSASACLNEALFLPWHRQDPTFSFRWDPEEDVRYALMAGDPTDSEYKAGTQHGANRLAAIGLAVLTVAPERRAGRVRPNVIGGQFGTEGFSFAWPIWRDPATVAAIRGLLAHPGLREPGGLAHLGVDHVLAVRRISVSKFMNFTRARILESTRLSDDPTRHRRTGSGKSATDVRG